jgi:hypothetical protein
MMANPFQGDDVDPFSGVRDKEGNIKQVKEKGVTKQIGLPRTAKLSPFGLAFDTARKAGRKTFEFKGKKYTTEMAKPKPKPKAAAPAKPVGKTADEYKKDAADLRAESQPEYDRVKNLANTMLGKETFKDRPELETDPGVLSGPFKKGGSVKESAMMKKMGRGMAKATMQKVASKAVKAHEGRMHKAKSGSSVSKRADGAAIRGKTRGRMM